MKHLFKPRDQHSEAFLEATQLHPASTYPDSTQSVSLDSQHRALLAFPERTKDPKSLGTPPLE